MPLLLFAATFLVCFFWFREIAYRWLYATPKAILSRAAGRALRHFVIGFLWTLPAVAFVLGVNLLAAARPAALEELLGSKAFNWAQYAAIVGAVLVVLTPATRVRLRERFARG